MNCTKCGNKLEEGAKFCGTCGKSVLSEKLSEKKKSVSASNVVKKIFQVITSILFVLSLGTMSSQYNSDGLLGTMHDLFNITAAIAAIMIFMELWKNRKTGKKWFGWRWIILLIIISVLGIGTVIFSESLTVAREKAMQNPDLKAEYINNVVNAVKAKASFPNKINESTTVTDITAERSAIRYHYILSGLDTSNLSDEYFKNSLSSSICQSEHTKNFFDKGINVEFLYTIENSTQSYFVSFTKTDCP